MNRLLLFFLLAELPSESRKAWSAAGTKASEKDLHLTVCSGGHKIGPWTGADSTRSCFIQKAEYAIVPIVWDTKHNASSCQSAIFISSTGVGISRNSISCSLYAPKLCSKYCGPCIRLLDWWIQLSGSYCRSSGSDTLNSKPHTSNSKPQTLAGEPKP